MHMRIGLLVLLFVASARAGDAKTSNYPWEAVHDRLTQQLADVSQQLDRMKASLLRWVDDATAKRYLNIDPALRKKGYGLVPVIEADRRVVRPGQPRRGYRLASVEKNVARLHADTRKLIDAPPPSSRDHARQWHRLAKRQRNLERHLAYHKHWQRTVPRYSAYYRRRNAYLPKVEEYLAARKNGTDGQAALLRRILLNDVAPFKPTERGIRVERRDGTLTLEVVVTTDIEDNKFLDAFKTAIQSTYTRARPSDSFALTLTFQRLSPSELYPGGAPLGDSIDARQHLKKFPSDALVLTTGGESTHAWIGRGIVLGTEALTPRVLAHEFGHLLGFEDTYLRMFEGTANEPYGVRFIEVRLSDDLMGVPRMATIDDHMFDTLIEHYSRFLEPSSSDRR
ncbi:MAG: hypothetical protein AAF493_02300 [Pseudomonadota bacterium]